MNNHFTINCRWNSLMQGVLNKTIVKIKVIKIVLEVTLVWTEKQNILVVVNTDGPYVYLYIYKPKFTNPMY